jgi:hypothetical protein
MIDTAQIPDEVVEAAGEAFLQKDFTPSYSFDDCIRAAIAAALNAWRGMEPHKVLTVRDNGEGYDLKQIGIILPLPQEARDE